MIRTLLLAALLVPFVAGVCYPGDAGAGGVEERVSQYRGAIERAGSAKEEALLRKELGELYVSEDMLDSAADEFMRAMALYDGFTEDEKLGMAVYVSWADRLEDAAGVLRGMLSANPGNLEARTHLARVLSWQGRYDEAIEEADRVLSREPRDAKALQVKADSLRWRGDPGAAMPLYQEILKSGDDFDARLGLSHGMLETGDRAGARGQLALLEPRFPYQERELRKLRRALARSGPKAEAGASYYDDTDENRRYRYEALLGFQAGAWEADLRYRHTEARDPSRSNSADDVSAAAHARLTPALGAGAGVGVSSLGDGDTAGYLTGFANVDLAIPGGTVGAGLSRETLSDTAELIENRIRFTALSAHILRSLTARWSARASYAYRDYSDDNHSHDAGLSTWYAVYDRGPQVNLGYRFNYRDFQRQSGGGYFDPDDFVSNQLYVSFYHETGEVYLYLEPYAGFQSFTRSGADTDDTIWGGYASFGLNLSDRAALELNAEGGNFAATTAAGFEYYMIGARITGYF
ncbi:MAG: tetratricopeptide repeat protein [Thermodesulfovibrionales bacterium]